MKILIAAHTQLGGTFVVGSHHLARELAQRGHDVTHLSTAITPLHVARLGDPEVRRRVGIARRRPTHDSNSIDLVVPIRVLPEHLGTRRSQRPGALQRRWLGDLDLGSTDLLLIDQPTLAWVLPHVGDAAVVYRPTDVYPDLRGDDRLRALEQRILDRSAGAIATSSVVHDHLVHGLGATVPTAIIENGVEHAHFRRALSDDEPPDSAPGRRPRAVYVGALDERFDWPGIITAARRLPDIDFDLVGPGSVPTDFAALAQNVSLRGAVDYGYLPSILADSSVGLLPLSDHPGNAGRSPMKFYEYRAAGLPVVARRTSELQRRSGEGVVLYDERDDLADAVRQALAAPIDRVAVSDTARAFDWAARAEAVERFALECGARA